MDTVSHSAWGVTIIRTEPYIWWAALFGALPDILLGIYGAIRFRSDYWNDFVNQRFVKDVEDPYIKVYFFLHSFIPITFVVAIIYFIEPRYVIITLPYYLHIIFDVFTHSGKWAVRLFYPLSNFSFNGRDWWKNKLISMGNWTALVVINIIIIFIINGI